MVKNKAYGTRLLMGDGEEPETFDEIAQVRNFSGPGLKVDVEDATTHDSPGGWEEVVPTVLRSGEIKLEILYDPEEETHNAADGLLKRLDQKILTDFRFIFPDSANTTWIFSAYVNQFEPGAPAEGLLTAALSLKISGTPILV